MNQRLIIPTQLILFIGLAFYSGRNCCADSHQITITPHASNRISSDNKNKIDKPSPPVKKGYFVNSVNNELITSEREHSQSGHIIFDLKNKPSKDISTPSPKDHFSLPPIKLPEHTGYFSANQPRSLHDIKKWSAESISSPTKKMRVPQNSHSVLVPSQTETGYTNPYTPQLKNKTSIPALSFSKSENHQQKAVPGNIKPGNIKQGAKLLFQIEIQESQFQTDLSHTNAQQNNLNSLNKLKPQTSIHQIKHQQQVRKANSQAPELNHSSPNSINATLTGIESDEDDKQDYYDVNYLRKVAGLEISSKNKSDEKNLLPLEEELANHGGSHLYVPEGDQFYNKNHLHHQNSCGEEHDKPLRLPEHWQKPKPLTGFQEFLGADAIKFSPGLKWFGENGYQWEPRFTGYGSYEIFGMHYEEGNREQTGVGHQLLLDLDLRVTGTERAHVQFRPVGRKNSGGSFYQFNSPSGYDDNSTLIPDRYWVEGEFRSIFNGLINDSFSELDYHFVVGKFPFALHNNILISDDVLGIAVNKNTILIPPFSNMNIQVFYLFDDVDTTLGPTADVFGTHLTADYQHSLLEATFAYVNPTGQLNDDTYYIAGSWTQFIGQFSLTGRSFYKTGDSQVDQDASLYVLESNYHTPLPELFKSCTGFNHAVLYSTAFHATEGWTPISGGNFDRLRSTFEVDPLISISRGRVNDDTTGVAFGYQLFANNDDESLIPEIAYEEPGNDSMYGVSLRYLYKLGPRTFLDCRTIQTWSNNNDLERKGAFVSTTVVF